MLKIRTILAISVGVLGLSAPVSAQNAAVSPVLLLESGPSDNPEYRRMVFTKYLQGDRVAVNYKAYNRTEFIQVAPQTPLELVQACTRGKATSLKELKAFEKAEAKRAKRGEAPEVVRFCIKNIRNWDEEARERYLDPIFNGLPPGPISIQGR